MIEISDSETPTPVKSKQATLSGYLLTEDKRPIASWSPNFEQKPVKQERNFAEGHEEMFKRLAAKTKAEQEKRGGMKMMGMDEEEVAHKKNPQVLLVKPQRGATQQVTNRN